MNPRLRYGILVVWPGMWLDIACSLVGICTLGYYVPSWSVNYMFRAGMWYTKKFRGR